MKRRLELAQQASRDLSVRRRCQILGVCRSRIYHSLVSRVDDSSVAYMNEIQEIYSNRPFQGYKRITDDLKERGYMINHKRVYRLMKLMGLQAVYPKRNLSKRRQEDVIYPYLLKTHPPMNPHDCWCVDITYLKTSKGFVYLTALIDVVSRCIMGYSLSPFLDTSSCLDALEMGLKTGFKPRIINSDQGCQFTSQEWLYSLRLSGIQISMDGKGRCLDNIPIERFWRTLKYEEVYLKTYDSVNEARENLARYIYWYNHERRHSGINKMRPYEAMMAGKSRFAKGDGYVDNFNKLSHIPTPPTTTTTTKQNDNNMMILSSHLAA